MRMVDSRGLIVKVCGEESAKLFDAIQARKFQLGTWKLKKKEREAIYREVKKAAH